jgi:YbgC/YbaW family acyl-CoA thioester hydrolase
VGELARISLTRRIEWMDTDAAGIYHWTTVFRLAEGAEAALHRALGIVDQTFGRTPRVHVTCDFRAALKFDDLVEVQLEVTRVGRASLTEHVCIVHEGDVAAEADIVICFVDTEQGAACPWPAVVREQLVQGGVQVEAPP